MKQVLTYRQSPRHVAHFHLLKIHSDSSVSFVITDSGLVEFEGNFNTCRHTAQLILSPDASRLSSAVVLHLGSFSTSSIDSLFVPPVSNKSRLSMKGKLRALICNPRAIFQKCEGFVFSDGTSFQNNT